MTLQLFIAMFVAVIIFALYSGNIRKKQRKSHDLRDELEKRDPRQPDYRHKGGDVWEDPTADDSPDICAWEEENRLSDEIIEMDRRAAEEIVGKKEKK